MKLGIFIHNFTTPAGPAAIGSQLVDLAQTVDRSGFTSLWVCDHLIQLTRTDPEKARLEMLEAYSLLGFFASLTKRVRLGTLVSSVTYRRPALLAKAITTIDVLSGGRACLGIGTGYYELEHVALGFPFPSPAERVEMLEENIRIVLQMWSGDTTPFDGKYNQLREPVGSPLPLASPRPPIMIGAGGEKKMLRLVAEYADIWNYHVADPTEFRRKMGVLKEFCAAVGRNYEDIEKSCNGLSVGDASASEVVDRLGALAEVGIQQAIFSPSSSADLASIELLAKEVIPQVAHL